MAIFRRLRELADFIGRKRARKAGAILAATQRDQNVGDSARDKRVEIKKVVAERVGSFSSQCRWEPAGNRLPLSLLWCAGSVTLIVSSSPSDIRR